MGNSASGMLTVKQPDKVAQIRDKKIIGDTLKQMIERFEFSPLSYGKYYWYPNTNS